MVGLLCAVFAVGLIVEFVLEMPFGHGRWKHHYWLVLIQVLFIPAVVALGVLYRVNTDPTQAHPKPNPVGDWGIDILFFLSLAVNCFWVYRMKGLRWFAFCLLALQQVFVFGAAFIAGMSITGDWL